MSKQFDPNDPDEIKRIKDMLKREGVTDPEEIERFIRQYSAKLIIPGTVNAEFTFNSTSESTSESTSGFASYSKNWQYAEWKEVIAIHERVDPYDWQLDVEMNEDFKLWEKEIFEV